MKRITVAGNIEAPIYKLLIDKGYKIEFGNNNLKVEKSGFEIIGESIIEVAGIILLIENKGEDWKVKDDEIDEYLKFVNLGTNNQQLKTKN